MNYVRVLERAPRLARDGRVRRARGPARRGRHVAFPTSSSRPASRRHSTTTRSRRPSICTQAATHREIAGRALELGKHVLVEKPFTVDVAEADELIELAEKVDRVLLTRPHVPLQRRRPQREDADGRRRARRRCTTCTRAARTSVRSARTSTRSGTSRRTTSRSSTTCSTTPRPGSAPWARASCATAGRTSASSTLGYPSGLIGHIHVSWADPAQGARVRRRRQRPPHRLQRPRRRRARPGLRPRRQGRPATTSRRPSASTTFRSARATSPAPSWRGRSRCKHLSGHFLHCIRRGDRPQTSGTRRARRGGRACRRSSSRWRTTARPPPWRATARLEQEIAGPVR